MWVADHAAISTSFCTSPFVFASAVPCISSCVLLSLAAFARLAFRTCAPVVPPVPHACPAATPSGGVAVPPRRGKSSALGTFCARWAACAGVEGVDSRCPRTLRGEWFGFEGSSVCDVQHISSGQASGGQRERTRLISPNRSSMLPICGLLAGPLAPPCRPKLPPYPPRGLVGLTGPPSGMICGKRHSSPFLQRPWGKNAHGGFRPIPPPLFIPPGPVLPAAELNRAPPRRPRLSPIPSIPSSFVCGCGCPGPCPWGGWAPITTALIELKLSLRACPPPPNMPLGALVGLPMTRPMGCIGGLIARTWACGLPIG